MNPDLPKSADRVFAGVFFFKKREHPSLLLEAASRSADAAPAVQPSAGFGSLLGFSLSLWFRILPGWGPQGSTALKDLFS